MTPPSAEPSSGGQPSPAPSTAGAGVRDQGRRPAKRISPRRLRRLHRSARRRRAHHLPLQRMVRAIVSPVLRLAWRPIVDGIEEVPPGAVLIVANHRSALDPLALMLALREPARFMATSDMFVSRVKARVFLALGAFPVQRELGDSEAITTSLELLAAGERLIIFAEGRLVRPQRDRKSLGPKGNPARGNAVIGDPRSGAGRIALAAGVPLVPASVSGMEHPSAAMWRRGAEVRVRFGAPVDPVVTVPEQPTEEDSTHEGAAARAAALVRDSLWPRVQGGLQELEDDRHKALAAGAAVGLVGLVFGAWKMTHRR